MYFCGKVNFANLSCNKPILRNDFKNGAKLIKKLLIDCFSVKKAFIFALWKIKGWINLFFYYFCEQDLLPPMEKKRIVFIVNPISGTQNKQYILKLLPEVLNQSLFEWHVAETEYAGHATLLAKNYAAEHYDAIIAIGGDGTVNEVARSLVHTEATLGIIPCGSGNGLARHLHIPMDPRGAINVINRFAIQAVDYGKINDIPFFCTCGVGFDAFVSSKFATAGKRGLLSYLENTLREGLKYKPDTYDIEIEGETKRYKAFLIACANASQYGNNAFIAPQASMSDGLMDVTIMEPFTMMEAPQIAIQLFNKTLLQNSRIKTLRCKNLHIHREHTGVIHYDGDPTMAGCDIDVQLIEKGLNVIINTHQEDLPIVRMFSEFYEELANLGSDIRRRNIRRINAFNKEIIKHIKHQ